MKVMLVNGSPHRDGTTNAALGVIAEQLGKEEVASEIFWPGAKPISGCIGCMACAKLGRCVIEGDRVNEFVELAESADGFVFGTPTHYAADAGHITSFMHRAFYSNFRGRGGSAVRLKPAAAVAVARRAGAVPAFDQLNRMFTICEMPVVSSRYWNIAFGHNAEELMQDAEGLWTLRTLARNMAFFLKCIEAGKKLGRCVIDGDRVNEFVELAEKADGFIFGTPTHYAADAGHITSFMHRAFYSNFRGRGGSALRLKPAAAVAVARRAGAVPDFDQLNRMFTICEMPVVSSRYWNIAFGHNAEELMQDAEGLWTLRTLARNMAFFLKCIDAGKKLGVTPPAPEEPVFTNFIR